jgi:hypothetical protein
MTIVRSVAKERPTSSCAVVGRAPRARVLRSGGQLSLKTTSSPRLSSSSYLMFNRRAAGSLAVLLAGILFVAVQLLSLSSLNSSAFQDGGLANATDASTHNVHVIGINKATTTSYAPIIIGAGQGTTGTHLFAESTCELGFTSLHYGVGCIPKYVTNNTDGKAASPHNNITSCPVTIASSYQHYEKLLKYHKYLTQTLFQQMNRKYPPDLVLLKESILNAMEEIIVWGKRSEVILALHDTPYPMLMPEILKLLQKHYGEAKPIILLSERDPVKYIVSRIKTHGRYTWICKPPNNQTPNILIEKVDSTTLRGGAFDTIGCIDKAISSSDMIPQLNQVFYTLNQARDLDLTQYLVESFDDYQTTSREFALLSYNMFDKSERTSVRELSSMILKVLSTVRMSEGRDFAGFKGSFDTIEGVGHSFNRTAMTLLNIFKMEEMTHFDKGGNVCPTER